MTISLTPYSLLTVIISVSIFMLFFILVTRKGTIQVPLCIINAILFIMCMRLLFPVEFSFVREIDLFDVLPTIIDIANTDIVFKHTDIKIFTVTNLFILIWVVVALIMIIKYLYKYFFIKNELRCIPVVSNDKVDKQLEIIKKKYNFNFSPKIIVSENVVPAEFGCFKQVIFLNKYNYTEEEIYYILLHEMTHFKLKTNITSNFVKIMGIILWWNPIIHLLPKHIDNLMEIYVDKYITHNLDKKERLAYIECIKNVYILINNLNTEKCYPVNLLTGSAECKVLLNRFKIIAADKKISKRVCAGVLTAAMISLAYSIDFVVQPAWEPPEEELKFSFTPENSYIIKENGKYVLYYLNEGLIETDSLDQMPKGIKYIER